MVHPTSDADPDGLSCLITGVTADLTEHTQCLSVHLLPISMS